MDSPKHFYPISEPLTDVASALMRKLLLVPEYESIAAIPETGPGPPYTLDSLTHIDAAWME